MDETTNFMGNINILYSQVTNMHVHVKSFCDAKASAIVNVPTVSLRIDVVRLNYCLQKKQSTGTWYIVS